MKIEIKKLTKKFKESIIIDDISLELKTGKIYGICGRNGSGKSVFLKLLSGIYVPTSGEILYDGINYNKERKFPPSTRTLIESPSFFPDLTGYENLKYLAEIQNLISDEEIEESLKQVNLFEEKDKKYAKYSLGMKQKLGIAQALMENPSIIILDEPFNGIEEETVKKIMAYLKNIKNNKIIIISSHIKEDLLNISDEIYNFDAGKINEIK